MRMNMLLAMIYLLSISSCTNAADLSLQVGDIAMVDTTQAIGFMSGITIDKGKWLQLGNTSVHPEALLRFMVLGAPPAGVHPNASWGGPEEEDVSNEGRLLATLHASIAQSRFHQAVKDLGNLHIHAWMLGFVCIKSTTSPVCESLAPAAVVNRVDKTSGRKCLEITTVWEKVLSGSVNLVTNTISAKLVNIGKEEKMIPQDDALLDEFSLNVLVSKTGVEACPNASLQVALRSSLDATYNLGPYACYYIGPQFKSIAAKEYLLVLGMQNSTTADFIVQGQSPASDVGYGYEQPVHSQAGLDTLGCIKRGLQNYQPVELGKCDEAPQLIMFSSPNESYHESVFNNRVLVACRNPNSPAPACLQLDPHLELGNTSECEDLIWSAFNSSDSYPVGIEEDSSSSSSLHTMNGINYIQGSSIYGVLTDKLCEVAPSIFNGGQRSTNAADDQLTEKNDLEAVDAEALGLLFTQLNNKYAQAHSDAFQLQYGSPPDFRTVAVALLGAAISVLTATIPFTNFLLRLHIKFFGTLHGSRHSHLKIVLLSGLNAGLAFVCYGFVVDTIKSEIQREEEFKTWAVVADSVVVNAMGLRLEALYVVYGTSMYNSKLLTFIWTLVSALGISVGGMTYQRCRTVLQKLKLIKEKSGTSASSDVLPLTDDYKAIEMGMAEYTELLHCQPPATAIDISAHGNQQNQAMLSPLLTSIPSNPRQIDNGADGACTKKVQFKHVALLVLGVQAFKHASKEQ